MNMNEAIVFEHWKLGGNLNVMGTVLESGVNLVWYPNGFPCSEHEGPMLGIFAPEDHEYEAPILVGGSFTAACSFLYTQQGRLTLEVASGNLKTRDEIRSFVESLGEE